jgi:hypothetical protein
VLACCGNILRPPAVRLLSPKSHDFLSANSGDRG